MKRKIIEFRVYTTYHIIYNTIKYNSKIIDHGYKIMWPVIKERKKERKQDKKQLIKIDL